MKVLQASIEPPSSVVPGIPPAWDAVVLRATRRLPAERFATARDMAIAVEACEGVASTTQVGEWVESLAASTLSSRAQMLEQIEKVVIDPQAVTGDSIRPETPILSGTGEHTRVASTVSTAVPPSRSFARRRRLGVAAAMLGLLGAAGTAWTLGGSYRWGSAASAPPAPSAPVNPVSTAPAPPPETATQVESTPAPPSQPSASSAPAASTPSGPGVAAGAPRTPQRLSPAPRPVSAVPPRPTTAPADCDPPYTLDADGHRHYKRQCLQ
jgi:serine/threonine-protein kinase